MNTQRKHDVVSDFYDDPTPVGAIELAIADHKAHCAPGNPQYEFVRELQRARDAIEGHAKLMAALTRIAEMLNATGDSIELHRNEMRGIARAALREAKVNGL